MVAPYRHLATPGELDADERAEMWELLDRRHRRADRGDVAGRVQLGVNLGRVAGAGVVGHLHLHVVPRWNGDTNFMPVLADVRVMPEHLSRTLEQVRAALAQLARQRPHHRHRHLVVAERACTTGGRRGFRRTRSARCGRAPASAVARSSASMAARPYPCPCGRFRRGCRRGTRCTAVAPFLQRVPQPAHRLAVGLGLDHVRSRCPDVSRPSGRIRREVALGLLLGLFAAEPAVAATMSSAYSPAGQLGEARILVLAQWSQPRRS